MSTKRQIIGTVVLLLVLFFSSEGKAGAKTDSLTDVRQDNTVHGKGVSAAAIINFAPSITTDGKNLYAVDPDDDIIKKLVISRGEVTTISGLSGVADYADGYGPEALFKHPRGITSDEDNLYVADTGNCIIRKIVISTGEVSTLAGNAGVCGYADGIGQTAQFGAPYGITTDGSNLYVADAYNSTIRKIVISTRAVTTLAGSAREFGTDDGVGIAARFNFPSGITTDGTNLYVVDNGSNTVREIAIATGEVDTLAGAIGAAGSVDGFGQTAQFGAPYGITTDGSNLYVTDAYNGTIRKIVISTRAVSTLVGSARKYGSDDGAGARARFNFPAGITTDGTTLYVADNGSNTVRKIIITTGEVTTLIGDK